MRLSSDCEIGLAADKAFAAILDLDRLERLLQDRGFTVSPAGPRAPQQGMEWTVDGRVAGTPRQGQVRLERWEAPDLAAFDIRSEGLHAEVRMEIQETTAAQSRIRLTVAMSAHRMKDRLLLKSLALMHAQIQHKLVAALHGLARDAEARANRVA